MIAAQPVVATSDVGTTILGEIDTAGTQGGFKPLDPATGLPTMIGAVIRGAMGLLGVIFLILVVYAGYKWMLAHGEPGEVKAAQKLLLNSIIGLILATAAYALTTFVVNAIKAITLPS